MKKYFLILTFILITLATKSNAKIITVDDKFKLDLPLNHKYLNLKEADTENELFDYEYLKSSGFEIYIVGDKKLIELLQEYIEGGDITKNDHIKNFIKKAERKASNSNISEKSFYNWGIKEMKKTLKSMDISGFTFVLYNKDISSFDISDLDEILFFFPILLNVFLFLNFQKVLMTTFTYQQLQKYHMQSTNLHHLKVMV